MAFQLQNYFFLTLLIIEKVLIFLCLINIFKYYLINTIKIDCYFRKDLNSNLH